MNSCSSFLSPHISVFSSSPYWNHLPGPAAVSLQQLPASGFSRPILEPGVIGEWPGTVGNRRAAERGWFQGQRNSWDWRWPLPAGWGQGRPWGAGECRRLARALQKPASWSLTRLNCPSRAELGMNRCSRGWLGGSAPNRNTGRSRPGRERRHLFLGEQEHLACSQSEVKATLRQCYLNSGPYVTKRWGLNDRDPKANKTGQLGGQESLLYFRCW